MIVIKNVKTPKTCYECPFGMVEYIKNWGESKREIRRLACCITGRAMTSTRRNKHCPIVDGEEVEE